MPERNSPSSSPSEPITPASASTSPSSAAPKKSARASAAPAPRTYVPIRPAFRPLLPKPPTGQAPPPLVKTEKDAKPKKKAERKPPKKKAPERKKTAKDAPLPNTIAPSSLITKKKRSQSVASASKKNQANVTAAALLSATTTTTNDPNDSVNTNALRNDSKVMLGSTSASNPLFTLDKSADLYLVAATADDNSLISLWDPASSPDLQQSPVDSLALVDDMNDDNHSDISSVYSEPLLSLESYLTPEPDEIDPDMHTVNDSFAFLGPAINI